MADRGGLALAGLLALTLAACANEQPRDPERPPVARTRLDSLRCGGFDDHDRCLIYDVSLYELLANPSTYHGKRVRVLGYVHVESEGNAIYPHREDLEKHLLSNGLWLEAPRGSDSVSGHYAIVEGRFDAKHRGHMGMWSATVDSITRLERWEFPQTRIDTANIPTIDLSRAKVPPT